MFAKVVRRKTASDVNVFNNMSANWPRWAGSGGVVSERDHVTMFHMCDERVKVNMPCVRMYTAMIQKPIRY